MIPKIVSPTELRQDLSSLLKEASRHLIVVTSKPSNKVIVDEGHYNRLLALAQRASQLDPEGEYIDGFVSDMLHRAKKPKYDKAVASLNDLL